MPMISELIEEHYEKFLKNYFSPPDDKKLSCRTVKPVAYLLIKKKINLYFYKSKKLILLSLNTFKLKLFLSKHFTNTSYIYLSGIAKKANDNTQSMHKNNADKPYLIKVATI